MTAPRWFLLASLAVVSVVAAALLLDESREFESALKGLREEQITIAAAVGSDFEARLSTLERNGAAHASNAHDKSWIARALGGSLALEQRGTRIILIAAPDGSIATSGGRSLDAPTVQRAIRERASSLSLAREETARFGLPPRIAVGGIHAVAGRGGTWGVVVLASAQRLRSREQHAQTRFLLGVGAVTLIVASFGLAAARQERRKLEVARALELSAFERERERLLAKADKMATLAALSSGIAHEVATPLGTIMARIEQVIPSIGHDARARAALGVALEQVERIQSVIRGMLGLSRGEMPPLVEASADRIAEAAVAVSRHRFAEANVAVTLALHTETTMLKCDPPMMEQALTNLLLNACDASTRGQSVVLAVVTEDSLVRFVVEDEGEGISGQTAARAYEPFFTTKPHGRGTGLGLAITREIVAHHGGRLLLEARAPERGTRAVIELPRA